ncbi:hypothetical protein V4C85_17650 [Ralstonia solanacearum]|uniref:Uncharacterized protein n=1 Tax=Ralstonia solanacearum TaxID=305 RepID=A0AAW5ZIY2_RALSL|nr:hypothetical protein [Ralstonia solanacearum]MBB6592500.1 hypothetical protein [Ralstonia solanacearum]MBB6596725.1 hypothetical protein [Ralstonia solanacearum]MDB0507913.1 hypothetical protein [Ralstonia solanacearum]MDB0512182.1 hypothetical protein [Ralstonia solanacearum]MDB0526641.1 hypothetical protein [Ralstonia solanacearum]
MSPATPRLTAINPVAERMFHLEATGASHDEVLDCAEQGRSHYAGDDGCQPNVHAVLQKALPDARYVCR